MEALKIRIPQRYQAGIAKLISLRDNSIQELLAALDGIPSTFNLDGLKSQIASKITTISPSEQDDIITATDALYNIRLEMGLPLADFIEKLLQAMEESGNEDLKLEAYNRDTFRDRLIVLLDKKLLELATKAAKTFYEHDRVLGLVRISTDVRSVFGQDTGNPPEAAIIVHNLKIHYIQGNEHKDIFVALDTADIAVIIESLRQAQEKAETLKTMLASTNVLYIDAK